MNNTWKDCFQRKIRVDRSCPSGYTSHMLTDTQTLSDDYQLVERAIQFIADHYTVQPSLDEIAASVHLSKYHFQRLFKRWAGITPTQFMHYLTLDHAKARLQASSSVLDAALSAGLSSPGRLHDLLITFEAVTPGDYKARGDGLTIRYGWHPTPFGESLIGLTGRGICALYFRDAQPREALLAELSADYPRAAIVQDQEGTFGAIQQVFAPSQLAFEGHAGYHLFVKGTNFQIRVWEALLRIPQGGLVTYGDIASYLGKPGGARAVGGAVGSNPISFLIPCHRVIASTGIPHHYRWGATRKRAMLAWEAAQSSTVSTSDPGVLPNLQATTL